MGNGMPCGASGAGARVALAGALLALGALVYLGARPPGAAVLVPAALDLPGAWPARLGPLAGPLPTFFHAAAFALLAAVALGPGRRRARAACALWLAVEISLELAQSAPVAARATALLPAWFARAPGLDHVEPYLLRGTFDPLDLAAAVLGVAAAWLILRRVPRRGGSHER